MTTDQFNNPRMSPSGVLRLFDETERASFLDRPNRFVVNCLKDGKKRQAYLPNPGRLRELLLPGSTLYLVKNRGPSKFGHTVVAVEKNGNPVLLHTHMANRVVEWLLRERAVPGYEKTAIAGREVTFGRSRFDFLLEREGGNVLVEVKSCTLFEGSVAMFPDAVTARGRRHLLALADMAGKGMEGGIIILINAPGVRWFLPDYHTDLDFAQAMLAVRNDIAFTPLSVGWDTDLSTTTPAGRAVIPWGLVKREANDGGSYIVTARVDRNLTVDMGDKRPLRIRKGHYCYVGSAATDLTKTVRGLLGKKKNPRRPIDYLAREADALSVLPIRSSESLECDIIQGLEGIGSRHVEGFGSSGGCPCPGRLFGMEDDPLRDKAFVTLLQYFRIGRLEKILEGK